MLNVKHRKFFDSIPFSRLIVMDLFFRIIMIELKLLKAFARQDLINFNFVISKI